jgi:peptide/nickel transport system substrate-binding protein
VANETFFLGRPKIDRVIVRAATDPEARLNLLLSGEADAMDNVPPPPLNIRRVAAVPDLRLIPVPSPTVGYLLFNQRNPADTSRPHPILSDLRVRQAITLALDRHTMVEAVFGPYADVPYGPVSPLLWIRYGTPKPSRQDVAAARRLLTAAGWQDRNGDGLLDRDGRPLALTLNFPGTSAFRRQLALLTQEQLRRIGIRIDLAQLEFPVWIERRTAGAFDIDFSSASQDPSPTGLTQSWSCVGGTNVARYCNPRVDSLIRQATLSRDGAVTLWHAALRQIEADAPAAFMYAPSYVYVVHRRYRNVTIRPESSWLALWQWSVDPSMSPRAQRR